MDSSKERKLDCVNKGPWEPYRFILRFGGAFIPRGRIEEAASTATTNAILGMLASATDEKR